MLGYRGMELWTLCLTFLLLICFFPKTRTESDSDIFLCGPALKTPGATFPKGDINLEYGSPLDIYCRLNAANSKIYNSSSLLFYQNDVAVPEEFVTRINESTLHLHIDLLPPSESIYYCKLKNGSNTLAGVCLNYVFVGFPPQPVQNFTCISHNWESMNCSWIPVHNYIKTKYNLSYYERTAVSRKQQYRCPEDPDKYLNYCVWNSSSDPLYRLVLETYLFNMSIENPFGNLTESFKIDHYAVVVPNKAINLTLIEATSSSLCISWSRPVALSAFPPGIVPRVMYQSKWDTLNHWQLVNTSHLNIKEDGHILNITGLKYAHTLYDIRVLLRSALAKEEGMWSEPATITLRTKATVPGMSPKTDIGSFEIRNVDFQRDIYIYWQQIPRFLENGDSFDYKVISVEEFVGGKIIERNIAPTKIMKTYAKFTNLTNNKYRFSLVSSNKEGISSDVSVITVPSKEEKLPELTFFSKMAHNSGVYELSWGYPHPIVRNYTIFWCENKQDRPYDCTGYLNWTTVCNVTEKNITLPEDKIYQFAISANNEYSSSGMLWARCTVLPDQAREKLKNIWINGIGATFIEVSWKLDCYERSRIRGFVISFCPIRNPDNSSCKEPDQNETIEGERTHFKIKGLKPYTTYNVRVAVKTTTLVGAWSDPLLKTTLEAAPDVSPTDIKSLGETNTSISLAWRPPRPLNGALRHYFISYNNTVIKVEDKSDFVVTNLTNLLSYSIYKISLSACTTACSPNSSAIYIQTKIGNPSQLAAPLVRFGNTTEILFITWKYPENPGGPIDHYDIQVYKSHGNELGELIQNIEHKGLKLEIQTPDCQTGVSSTTYKVTVRAVNIVTDASSQTKYYGQWSPLGEDTCYVPTTGFSVAVKISFMVILIVFMIIFCIAFVYFTRCAWLRFKAMQNVGVKLPPQLELNSVFKDKSVADLPITAHVCSASLKPHHHNGDLLDESTTPDQQLLLDSKIKDEGSCDSPCEDDLDFALDTGSGEGRVESSGCGSGHDSVSSSITAGTHITDSGTEADERPASPDVFSQSPRRLSDLRQRNITGASSGGGGGSGEGYSRLAAAPTGGYITLPQGPRTYVSHAHLWPHHNGSVQQYHKDYVTAPPLSTSTYSKVGMLSTTGLKINSNRDHCGGATDSDNGGTRNEEQLSINPASSI